MAYKFQSPLIAKAAESLKRSKKASKKKASKKKASKKKASKKARKRVKPPAHFPPGLAKALGYYNAAKKKASKKKASKKKASKKRAPKRKATPKKKTPAQIHAMRVEQGKRLARLRKKQLKARKG